MDLAALAIGLLATGLAVVFAVTDSWPTMKSGKDTGNAQPQIWQSLAVKLAAIMIGFPFVIVAAYGLVMFHVRAFELCTCIAGPVVFYYMWQDKKIPVPIFSALAIFFIVVIGSILFVDWLEPGADGFHHIKQAREATSVALNTLIVAASVLRGNISAALGALIAVAVVFYYTWQDKKIPVPIFCIIIFMAMFGSVVFGWLVAGAVGYHYIKQARGRTSAALGSLVIAITVCCLSGIVAVNMFGR